ncbi:MAG: hypothetical protein ACK56F_28290, partial [bacterium]
MEPSHRPVRCLHRHHLHAQTNLRRLLCFSFVADIQCRIFRVTRWQVLTRVPAPHVLGLTQHDRSGLLSQESPVQHL